MALEGGNNNTVAEWSVAVAILLVFVAATLIVIYGRFYEHTEVFSFDSSNSNEFECESETESASSDDCETTELEDETTTYFISPEARSRKASNIV